MAEQERVPSNAETSVKAALKENTGFGNRLAAVPPAESLYGENESAYAGTDPIYQNHANDVDKPLKATSGVDKLLETAHKEAATQEAQETDPAVVGNYATSQVGVTGGQKESESEAPANDDSTPEDDENNGQNTGQGTSPL